jgi:Ca2+-binding EF-hand superfamily protein
MIMDDNGDKRLSKEELRYGLRDYGVELNIRELDEMFNFFDRDRNGFVDVTEFLVGIRGDLNERRKKVVKMAFDILDKDGSGFVTVDEIEDVYDVSANPDVQCGKKTIEEALKEFIGQWEGCDKDGIVSLEEFEDYYKEISASIDGDDYFELMMRNAWRIAGGEGAAANTANLRVLVTDKDGKQKVATVEQELGLKQGDREDIVKRLTKQGVDAANVELYGGMDTTEKPKAQRQQPAVSRAADRAVGTPKQLESKAGVNVGNPRTTYSRNLAAVKLAAAFRGRVGRKKALAEQRKATAAAAAKAQEEAEKSIPRPKRLIRPTPKRK